MILSQRLSKLAGSNGNCHHLCQPYLQVCIVFFMLFHSLKVFNVSFGVQKKKLNIKLIEKQKFHFITTLKTFIPRSVNI